MAVRKSRAKRRYFKWWATALTTKRLNNRKGRCLAYDPWNQDAEPGDYMVDAAGRVFRLTESEGRNRRDAGELSMRRIAPPAGYTKATLQDGRITWVLR
jgi:hypothetical protein